MPETEANMIDAVSKMEARPEEMAFQAKKEQAEIADRLNSLFGNESRKIDDKAAAEGDYETVNEEATTDTTSGMSDGTTEQRASADNTKKETAPVEEGILSSDEEKDA